MRIKYEDWKPRGEAVAIVQLANTIARDYASQGYDLTLRQLYYQFVARDLLPNTQKSYDKLGSIINKARLAGLFDWNYLVDRTRNIRSVSHWDSPADVIEAAAQSFRIDKWSDQPTRVEVWVEKEALAGVVQRVANRNDVAWFSCRGYVSQSEMWGAAQRLGVYLRENQNVHILHLGDHDPSGLDMTRDIRERLEMFTKQDWYNDYGVHLGRGRVTIDRIALNIDQIEEYNPPPNPAKLSDSRAEQYVAEYGSESWELDALDPATLDALIESHLNEIVDDELYAERQDSENTDRTFLAGASRRWSEVVELLENEEITEVDDDD